MNPIALIHVTQTARNAVRGALAGDPAAPLTPQRSSSSWMRTALRSLARRLPAYGGSRPRGGRYRTHSAT